MSVFPRLLFLFALLIHLPSCTGRAILVTQGRHRSYQKESLAEGAKGKGEEKMFCLSSISVANTFYLSLFLVITISNET